MSTINNLLSNTGYYQLFGQSATSNNSGNLLAGANPAADALLQGAFPSGNSSSKNSSILDDAFLLDLSPAAQQVLNGLGNNSNTGTTPDISSLLGGSSSGTGDLFGLSSFLLTGDQQKSIADILAKYKDAPYTQDTFNQIQNDLQAAGLSPDRLAMQDKVKSFDPVTLLMDALDGKNGSDTLAGLTGASDSNEQTKTNSYVQQIIKQWQSLSSTFSPDAVAPISGA